MTLYEKVQKLCREQGFEISNLGEKIGISITKGSISKWKSGAVPRPSTVKKIADYFGVPVQYFYESNQPTINTDDFIENVTDDLFKKRKLLFDKTAKATEEDMDKILKIISTLMGDDNE